MRALYDSDGAMATTSCKFVTIQKRLTTMCCGPGTTRFLGFVKIVEDRIIPVEGPKDEGVMIQFAFTEDSDGMSYQVITDPNFGVFLIADWNKETKKPSSIPTGDVIKGMVFVGDSSNIRKSLTEQIAKLGETAPQPSSEVLP